MIKTYSGWGLSFLLAIICAVQFYYRVNNAVTESYGNDELRYQARSILAQQKVIYDLSGKYNEEEMLNILKKRCQLVKKDADGTYSADSMKIVFEKGKMTVLTDMNQGFLEGLAKQGNTTLTGQQFRAVYAAYSNFLTLLEMRNTGANGIEDYKIIYSEDEKFSYVYFAPVQKEINGGDVKYTISKKDYSIQKKVQYR